jgi:hypothetical protein
MMLFESEVILNQAATAKALIVISVKLVSGPDIVA